jgi:hypothetical protein
MILRDYLRRILALKQKLYTNALNITLKLTKIAVTTFTCSLYRGSINTYLLTREHSLN